MFKEIKFLGEIVDIGALPMSGGKSSMFTTFFSNQNFTIYLSQFCIYFFPAHRTDAFCFFHTSASIIRENNSSIIDIVIKRSHFLTFSTMGAEVNRRIEAS